MTAARLLTAGFGAAAATSIAALAAAWISRYARTGDAALWHGIWSSIALASFAAPAAALISPLWQITIDLGPANPIGSFINLWGTAPRIGVNAAAAVAAAGSAILLSRLIWGCLRTRQLIRAGQQLPAAERRRVDRLVPGVGAHCRIHRRLRVPVAIGWRRGVVLLPASAAAWPDDRLRAILLHEQRHVLRRDFLWNVVAAAQLAVYWWNPLAWLIARRIRLTAELASDRDAAAAGPAAYARHLIAAAQELSHLPAPHSLLAPSAASDLERRVEALLNNGHAGTVSGRRVRLAMLVVAAAVVVAPMLVQARAGVDRTPTAHAARHAERHQH